jgi:hypothetical protein
VGEYKLLVHRADRKSTPTSLTWVLNVERIDSKFERTEVVSQNIDGVNQSVRFGSVPPRSGSNFGKPLKNQRRAQRTDTWKSGASTAWKVAGRREGSLDAYLDHSDGRRHAVFQFEGPSRHDFGPPVGLAIRATDTSHLCSHHRQV